MVTNTTADLLVTSDGEKVRLKIVSANTTYDVELSYRQAAQLGFTLLDAFECSRPRSLGERVAERFQSRVAGDS